MGGIVSVIIPIYNVEKYLIKCVESVTQQTYSNLQIILVDDGSTDRGGDICNLLAHKDARIEVVHKENGGLSSARNTGLKAAKGEYIFFLDADDYIMPQLVEICVAAFADHGGDVIAFNYVYENEYGDVIYKTHFRKCTYQLNSKEKKINFLTNIQTEYDNLGWNAWNRFYKAEVLLENQIYFPDNKEIFAEDLAYAMRVCLHAKRISVIPDVLYHYVNRDKSIMGSLQQNPLEKFVRLCLDFEIYAGKNGFQKEIVELKGTIFSKILYHELKKECNNYYEMAKRIFAMVSHERERVSNWFLDVRFSQVMHSRYKIRALFMYCEICLANRILLNKKDKKVPEYWIWYLIWCLKKGRSNLSVLKQGKASFNHDCRE